MDLIKKHLFTYLFLICFWLNAQQQKTILPSSPDFNKIATLEKEKIIELYDLFDKDQKSAYHKTHLIKKKLRTDRQKANASHLIAIYFNQRGNIDSAMYYAKKMLEFKHIKDPENLKKIHSSAIEKIANCYFQKGLHEESKRWRIKGLEISKDLDPYYYYSHIFGLGLAYLETDEYDLSIAYFKKCLNDKVPANLAYGSYLNLGDVYGKMKNYPLSNEYLTKAIDFCIEYNDNKGLAIAYSNLGKNKEEENKLNEAIGNYKKVIEITDKNEYYNIGISARQYLAELYSKTGDFKDSELLLTSSLKLARKYGLLGNQMKIYKALKNNAISRNNLKKALSYQDDYYLIKDSIYGLQKHQEVNELEIKFKTSEKEKKIEELQFQKTKQELIVKNQIETLENLRLQKKIKEKINESKILELQIATERRKNQVTYLKKDQEHKKSEIKRQEAKQKSLYFVFGIILLFLMGILILYLQRLKAQRSLIKKEKEVSEEKIKTLIKDQELKLIKATLSGKNKERKRVAQQLHDSIGGNLAAIKLQLSNLLDQPTSIDCICDQLDETYKQVRYLSHNLIPKKILEKDFILLLKEYTKNIGGASDLKVQITAYPENEINQLDEELLNTVFTIIQELLTNTIKHANATKIEIQLDLIESILHCIYEDNGKGFNEQKNTRGIGISNIKSKVGQLDGNLDIDSHPKRGTIVNINIPLKLNKHEV